MGNRKHDDAPLAGDADPDRPRHKLPNPTGRDFRLPEGALYAREARFIDALLELLRGGEPLNDDTLTAAGRQAFRFGGLTDAGANKKALRQAREMMSKPNVLQQFTDLFAEAGFTKADAAKAHVAHITEGNYQALRDYWKMVMPQAPKQIEMKAAVMNMTPDDFEASRLPAQMAARQLGTPYEQIENKSEVMEFTQVGEKTFVTDEREAVEESGERA